MDNKKNSQHPRTKPVERFIGFVFVAVAVFLTYSIRGVDYRPAAFPMALLAILSILGLIVAFRPITAEEPRSFRKPMNIVGSMVIIGVYVFMINVIGFLYATIIFIAGSLVVSDFQLGYRFRYPSILLISVLIALILNYALVDFLKLPMP